MAAKFPEILIGLKPELEKFPPQVLEQFERASKKMPSALSDDLLVSWAKTGITIANLTIINLLCYQTAKTN